MLQGIRASTLTMPPFGHNTSLAGVQKVESYGETDSWNWPHQSHTQPNSYSPIFDPSLYTNFILQPPVPGSVQPRQLSIATSRVINTGTSTPPPPRQQIAGSMVKAQPAFKPTWHGFLDTTKDAMTIVEAALQGRLSHISRRPHDKERAEMLTSGTILVYEENASGIKRWTDAVHWSPSRVMNNCLIYRQLIRALKPEEKRSALNPSCGVKRKRKETSSPSITKTGNNTNNSEDEYETPAFDSIIAGDVAAAEPMGKVYANFAQNLTPDQQRRFCGSLIDSYEFKEGGLMKKTISVKYQGTTHHVISYYSLEDVVEGKLKRPCQDSKLADVQPRPELLANWKVSIEDEESKDAPFVGGYSHQLQPSNIHQQPVENITQGGGAHGIVQPHPPLHTQVSEYWQGGQVNQYTSTHQNPQQYSPSATGVSHYVPQQYPVRQPSPLQYSSQQNDAPLYSQASSPPHYSSQSGPAQQYPSPAASTHHYTPQGQQTSQQYSSEQHLSSAQHYPLQPTAPRYPAAHQEQVQQLPQYTVPQVPGYDVHLQSNPNSIPHKAESPIPQQDPHRRASAPVSMQTYGQPPYHAPHPHPPPPPPPQSQSHSHSHSYYVADHKYAPGHSYGY